MNRLLLLCFFSVSLPNLAEASHLESPPPTCDTLITMSGKTYLVKVGWQGNQEIQYQLCEDENGRVYSISRDSIRDLKKQKNPIVGEQGPTSSKYKSPRDTFDLLMLTNGETYRVIILVRDYLNTYYRLYDDPLDDRQYCVTNREVQSVKLNKLHKSKQKKSTGQGCLIALLIILGLPLLLVLIGLAG